VFAISRPPPIVRERRQWARMPCNIPASWSSATERQRPERQATIRNACPGGLGLLVTGSLEPGALIAVRVRGVRPGQDWNPLARVVHAAGQRDGRCLVGVAFVGGVLDEEGWEAVLAALGVECA
jgi:hypothetical protein